MTTERFGARIPAIDTTPNRPVIKEAEARQSIGVALLIVGLDPRMNGDNATNPLIWTIKELRSKPETAKVAGELSIPAETKKINEDREANILGALAEFGDDESLGYLRAHLFLVEDVYREKGIIINGKPVDIAVLIYDGSLDLTFNPVSGEEVSANGWIKRDEIQKMEGVRAVLKQALEIDRREGLTARALETYYEHPELLKPAFPVGFGSMHDFYSKREEIKDVLS